MFKLALVLSTKPSANIFRTALTSAFHSGHFDHFLVCSGFFHERDNTRGPFFASDAFVGARLPVGSEVTVVGAYDPAASEFDHFVSKLSRGLKTSAGGLVPVYQRRSLRKYANRWHAKVFVARAGAEHRFAVVGSSNLTRSAFDVGPSNNEADVLIWDDSHAPTRQVADVALSDQQGAGVAEDFVRPTVIISNYNPADARNTERAPMNDRLRDLWRDILFATT